MHAVVVLTILGLTLGFLLGVAAKKFKVESDPVVDKVNEILPGTNCGQCGLAGCSAAADAIANGSVAITICPPGGRSLAEELSALLNVPLDASSLDDEAPQLARVNPDLCTGCVKCFKVCPTDAIVGAPKQIHAVMYEACTGCKQCIDECPTECLEMFTPETTVATWTWPEPIIAAHTEKAA